MANKTIFNKTLSRYSKQFLLLVCFFVIFKTGTVFAEVNTTIEAVFGRIELYVDGVKINRETLLYNGVTYLPIREAADALGKNVRYDNTSQTVFIEGAAEKKTFDDDYRTQYGEKKINVIFGRIKLVVDGMPINAETMLYNGTVYVPLRAASEALGKEIYFDDINFTAYLGNYYDEYPSVPDFGECFNIELSKKDLEIFRGAFYLYNDVSLDKYHAYIARITADRFGNYDRSDGTVKISDTEFIKKSVFVAVTYDENSKGLSVLVTDLVVFEDEAPIQTPKNIGAFSSMDDLGTAPPITREAFQKIKVGMTYEEVTQIAGSGGKLIFSSIGSDNVTIVTVYEWSPPYALYANAVFGDGVVTNKNWN